MTTAKEIETNRKEMRQALEHIIRNYENRSYEFYPQEYILIKEAKKALKEV